jgi:hypothetical protein
MKSFSFACLISLCSCLFAATAQAQNSFSQDNTNSPGARPKKTSTTKNSKISDPDRPEQKPKLKTKAKAKTPKPSSGNNFYLETSASYTSAALTPIGMKLQGFELAGAVGYAFPVSRNFRLPVQIDTTFLRLMRAETGTSTGTTISEKNTLQAFFGGAAAGMEIAIDAYRTSLLGFYHVALGTNWQSEVSGSLAATAAYESFVPGVDQFHKTGAKLSLDYRLSSSTSAAIFGTYAISFLADAGSKNTTQASLWSIGIGGKF